MQCIKEFIFLNMLGIMVILKLFHCFLFVFAYFCSLIFCVYRNVRFHFSIPTPWRVSGNLIGERGLKC